MVHVMPIALFHAQLYIMQTRLCIIVIYTCYVTLMHLHAVVCNSSQYIQVVDAD